jgi:hypothetical protein
MTEQQEKEQEAGGDVFARYVDAMGDAPLLGYLVLYSVFDGTVSPAELAWWFAELGLDAGMLPGPIRADGAFETVTSNTTLSYDIPGPDPAGLLPGRDPAVPRTATLMVRKVRRDGQNIVCHVVREVRESAETRLDYTDGVADVTFCRDTYRGAAPGAGTLRVYPNPSAIPAEEHERLRQMLTTLSEQFDRHSHFLTGDKIRVMLRAYIESLHAIRVRPTGGVYFVHHRHHKALGALRTLIQRFGQGSHLYSVPLPDKAEMRDMVIESWRTKARQDLQKLATDIAAAQATARHRGTRVSQKAIEALYRKFQALQADAGEHSTLLSADLDETAAAMQLVSIQLTGLLAQAA